MVPCHEHVSRKWHQVHLWRNFGRPNWSEARFPGSNWNTKNQLRNADMYQWIAKSRTQEIHLDTPDCPAAAGLDDDSVPRWKAEDLAGRQHAKSEPVFLACFHKMWRGGYHIISCLQTLLPGRFRTRMVQGNTTRWWLFLRFEWTNLVEDSAWCLASTAPTGSIWGPWCYEKKEYVLQTRNGWLQKVAMEALWNYAGLCSWTCWDSFDV